MQTLKNGKEHGGNGKTDMQSLTHSSTIPHLTTMQPLENGRQKTSYRTPTNRRTKDFKTDYSDVISGAWSRVWSAYQLPSLPKHRINHTKNKLICTCGAGPFESMLEWSKHATS